VRKRPHGRAALASAAVQIRNQCAVLVHNNDKVIAIYGVPYEPGQLIAIKIQDVRADERAAGPVVLEREKFQLWPPTFRPPTSSPILAGGMV